MMDNPKINAARAHRLIWELNFPRPCGSEGERRAAQLLLEHLKEIGVPGKLEPFSSPWIEASDACVEIGGQAVPVRPAIEPVLSGPFRPVPETLDVTGILSLEIEGPSPSGEPRIVVHERCNYAKANAGGAKAQLFLFEEDPALIAYVLASDQPVPSAYVPAEHRLWVRENLGQVARVRWGARRFIKKLTNVSAEITGWGRPEEIVIVGAHLDSFPGTVGASDNAAGCALLMEVARWFAEHPPMRTVRMVWFTGEEIDRRGSQAYVRDHLAEPERVVLYVNVDSGCSIEHGPVQVAVTGGDAVIGWAKELLADRTPVPEVRQWAISSADVKAFWEDGVPTAWACARMVTPYPHPHLPTDTPDKIDLAKLQVVGDITLTLVDAAQQTDRLPFR